MGGVFRFWGGLALWFFSVTVYATEAEPCAERVARLGSHFNLEKQSLEFRLFSAKAERVEVWLFDDPHGEVKEVHPLKGEAGLWETHIPWRPADRPIYYGYRIWGPNWTYDPNWVPGSQLGFKADVDSEGNRFNPNKLLLDPYTREISHDPLTRDHPKGSIYLTGPKHRYRDSAPSAPKGIVLPEVVDTGLRPIRPFKDEIIYEVHVRGFTKTDPSIAPEERGTYRGAARKATYLKALGITAVELLPIHEFQNDLNRTDDTRPNNYWGYMTLNYFSPDRRYAMESSRQTWGGVTQEFREMVEAFHQEGIKVYLDVVYNHTIEGHPDWTGDVATLLSFRGIDNATYYQTSGRWYQDNNGCGPNFNCAHPVVRNLILDSCRYFYELGVDGFRFDLASVLGNTRSQGLGFEFDKMPSNNVLNRAIRELPARPAKGGYGADLIAEPWAIGPGTYQLGHFPFHPKQQAGWAEWNGNFRDVIRRSINKVGIDSPTPGELAQRLTGSFDLFQDDGRHPWHSVNKVTSHDGFTLKDLFTYNQKQNQQSPPFGPSDGGDDNGYSWDQQILGESSQNTQERRRQAARTAMVLNLLSFGVPMILGGDEFLRSQRGNNNAWNVDAEGSWFDWAQLDKNRDFFDFTRSVIAFRRTHSCLRPAAYVTGEPLSDGVRDIAWYQADGQSAEDRDLAPSNRGYMSDARQTFLAYRINAKEDANAASIFIAYNWGFQSRPIRLPLAKPGHQWHWVGDTSQPYEGRPFREVGQERPLVTDRYTMNGRSVAVFVEKKCSD